jgi:hypothetical protein
MNPVILERLPLVIAFLGGALTMCLISGLAFLYLMGGSKDE